jgi:ElaB/YqjD/DUF883 family membrane-anchored ribosome-binding protein
MSQDLEPLSYDTLAVLRQLDAPAALPDGAHDRILRAVEARIALTAPSTSSQAPVQPAPRAAMPFVASHPWGSLAAALAVGVVLVASMPRAPEVRVVPGPATVSAPSAVTAPVTPSSWTPVPVPVPAASPAPAPSHASAPPATGGQELAAESAILDIARAAIARGEADHALTAVERHRASFPHGVLSEERDALTVKALVLAGMGAEARAQAAKFRAAYPDSLFLPALESALKSIP